MCNVDERLHMMLKKLSFHIVIVLLRTFALYEMDKRLAAVLLTIMLTVISVTIVSASGSLFWTDMMTITCSGQYSYPLLIWKGSMTCRPSKDVIRWSRSICMHFIFHAFIINQLSNRGTRMLMYLYGTMNFVNPVCLTGLAGIWGSLLSFDTIIIFLTLRKALIVQKSGSDRLFWILIRDGMPYPPCNDSRFTILWTGTVYYL